MTPSVFRMAPCVYMKQLTCYSVCHQAHNLRGKRMHTGQMATWRHSILVWCLFFHIHDCKCFTVLVWLVDAKILITFLFQDRLEKTTGSCVKHKQVYSSLISTFLGFFFFSRLATEAHMSVWGKSIHLFIFCQRLSLSLRVMGAAAYFSNLGLKTGLQFGQVASSS